MSSRLIKNLKTLFHTYIYYKEDDETNFHNWITENVTYTDGGFENKSTLDQELTVRFESMIIAPGYRRGYVRCNINPGVEGQTVKVRYVNTSGGDIATATLTTNINGYCYFSDIFYRNYDATITAEPITVNGVYYKGDTTTYRF